MKTSTGRSDWYTYVLAAIIIAVSLTVLRFTPAISAGAAAPVLLLIVLFIARAWGTRPALLASVFAALGYNYYFLPPLGFGIENPTNLVDFLTFTIAAILVGELSASAERRRLEAQAGRREIERLYQELQAAFDRASEAEAARRNEQLKAALLDALTHNLRTPLTSIKAAVTALIATAGGDQPISLEGRRDLLEVIDEESDRLNRFIEGLSAADRPDASQPTSLREVRLEDIVRAGLTRAVTVTRDHRIKMSIDRGIPPLLVDAAAVTEVFYILLDNASKYSPPGTEISVLASIDDSRHVRIAVMDEGPGISESLRERVFEKFFRIDGREPTDPQRKGIGLGLPIARRLIEAQAGRIWIETPASGHGTSVVLTLPLSAEVPGTVRATA